jgi:hypothetical protein
MAVMVTLMAVVVVVLSQTETALQEDSLSLAQLGQTLALVVVLAVMNKNILRMEVVVVLIMLLLEKAFMEAVAAQAAPQTQQE